MPSSGATGVPSTSSVEPLANDESSARNLGDDCADCVSRPPPSSSSEDVSSKLGEANIASAVAVGVSGTASLCRVRKLATSPFPPSKGVEGPRYFFPKLSK